MHVVTKSNGLGGFDVYSDGKGGTCAAVDAADLGLFQNNSFVATFEPIDKNHPGYDPQCNCYCWGYRPKQDQLIGLPNGAFPNLGALGVTSGGWRVCNSTGYSSRARCPCTNVPDCPTCPPRTPCPPQTPCPPPAAPCPPQIAMTEPTQAPEKFGVNVGLLVAAGLAGGVGWYGYKKGWFKKSRR